MTKAADISLAEAAARLHKSKRWLQTLLAEDRRRPEGARRYEFHEYIGRSPVWTTSQFEMLRAAIKHHSTKTAKEKGGSRPGCKSGTATATGMYLVASGSAAAQSALEKLQAFRPGQTYGKTPTPSASKSKGKSATRSSTASGRPAPSRSLRIVT